MRWRQTMTGNTQNEATTDELDEIEVTVDVDSVVKALELNATHGVDDRVIAVPQEDGAKAKIRRAFRGTERYSNPETAPVHVRPDYLVEDAFSQPPERRMTADAIDVPDIIENRDEADEELIDEQHEMAIKQWKCDVRRMIEGKHEFEAKGNKITLVGVENEQ